MNALVISGGGSKGAYAGGVAEYLICDCGRDYDVYVGTSTGGLLAPLLAAG
ncbi:MAG: patatin-like phospholipase family protein [Lewinella sp.]|nr:patatin-like phospholipase family protein [Lewinella sp.]